MKWPMIQDYTEAIQNPNLAFSDSDLRTGEVMVGPWGVPLSQFGTVSNVYHVRGSNNRDWAVKCFTQPVVGLDLRYRHVSDALANAKLPFTVGVSFQAEGIRVGGEWRPLVKMEWVEGLMLNQFVQENLGRPQFLAALAQVWGRLCRRLREAGIAHADLQHGNVIVMPGARPGLYEIKLIDYDGMFVPSLANTPSGENGHAAYQHPSRTSDMYSPDLDRFSHLVVATALKALELGGIALWRRYDNGNNLLFSGEDFRDTSRSKLMQRLWSKGTPELRALVGRLALACVRPISETPWLDEIAPEGLPLPLNTSEVREVEFALGLTASGADPKSVSLSVTDKPFNGSNASQTEVAAGLSSTAVDNKAVSPPLPSTLTGQTIPSSVVTQALNSKLDHFTGPEKVPSTVASSERKSPTQEPEPEAKSKSIRVPVMIGGIILLTAFAGGLLLLNKRPTNAGTMVADKGDDKNDKPNDSLPIKPKVTSPDPKPKEQDPKPKDPDPKPKDPDPKPKEPDPKPKEPDPKPKEPDPKPKEPASLMPRWNVPLETEGVPAKLCLDSEAQLILAGSERTSLLSFELENGSKRLPFDSFGPSGGNSVCLLDGGRVAKCLPDGTMILTWELKTGKIGERYPVPKIAPGTGKATHTCVHLSPDAQYLVVARFGVSDGEYPSVPFRVFDTKSGKTLLAIEWTCGSIHFAAGSSRLLVAEWNGRFRWFKLPTGVPDGEWDYGLPAKDRDHTVMSISKDGSAIGYKGPAKAPTESGPCLLDGRTGAVMCRFDKTYHENSPVVLSGDGRRAGVVRKFAGDEAIIDVVTVPKGDVINQVKLQSMQTLPTFALSDRGDILLVHDPKSGKLLRYDLPPQ